jgi:2-oxoisovalerate dehydrogenase E2 component (dihydrolipoyl transacylase)
VSQLKQFLLPDVGEGLTEGEIVTWLVAVGDTVSDGQPIVEVETAKVTVELPCPYDGVVATLHAAAGDTVDVGRPLVTIDLDPTGAGAAPADPATSAARNDGPGTTPAAAQDGMVPVLAGSDDGGGATLVGYGPRSGSAVRRARTRPGSSSNGAPEPAAASAASAASAGPGVLAKPPVRKLAKDLGIDLTTVTGTGDGGVVTRADVENAGRRASRPAPAAAAPAATAPSFGADRERRIPIKGVRKHTAAAMVASAFTAPHVTEFLAVDITPTMELRRRLATRPEFADLKVSPLLLVAKALLLAVRRNPMVNSSWDEDNGEIVIKEYVNLGIAAATDRGLIVPNIKDAGRLSLSELAASLRQLTEAARAGTTSAAELADGTISITNVGVFGIDTGTPILPPGETAILALGAIRDMPWVVDGQVVPRQVVQLSLSFDHRVVDGQAGSQFLADIGAMVADPAMVFAFS